MRAVIYLGRLLPDVSSGTLKQSGKKTNPSPSDLASNRGLPSQRLSTLLVRSYRTFAPLPIDLKFLQFKLIGGIFLWHYPHGRPHWELPSKFGLSEARTFLKQVNFTHLQPPRWLS
jgi:hypothetical protein